MTGVRIGENIEKTFVANNLVYSPKAMDIMIVDDNGLFTIEKHNIYPIVHPFVEREPVKPLDFQLDSRSGVPFYRQIIDQIRFGMATGRVKVGDQLPTVRALAVHLKVNLNTVTKAYKELEIQKILEQNDIPVSGAIKVKALF